MGASGNRTAVVTGGNRGIGLEVCRQLADAGVRVVLTARNPRDGEQAAASLRGQGAEVSFHPLDVSDPRQVGDFAAHAGRTWPGLDMLVNNAGISLKGFNAKVARDTLAVNYYGAQALSDALLPHMAGDARIVMVSSGLGAVSCLSRELQRRFLDPGLTRAGLAALVEEFAEDVAQGRHKARGWPSSAYSVSKVSLNALIRVLARELEGGGRAVNAVCPGWVRTGMGGRMAPRGPAKGAQGIVWAALLGDGAPSGGFFRDKKPIGW